MTSSAVDLGRSELEDDASLRVDDESAFEYDESPLEGVLFEVNATLADLLAAADEQHAAVVADNRKRLEVVTRMQERLAARLGRTEQARLALLAGRSLAAVVAELPADEAERLHAVTAAIADQVRELQRRNARTASLIERSAELAADTVAFLEHLVSPSNPSYGAHGRRAPQHSALVDRRA